MVEGPADVGSPFDSALGDEQRPCANSMNSSRAASSPSDLEGLMGLHIRKEMLP